MYIKLDEQMQLTVTVREPLYRGDNLNRKLLYLAPMQIGEIDLASATLYLSYIRADGVADIICLERSEEQYNENYYQYTVPVTCKLSKYPGVVCTWISIYAGSAECPKISKSSECVLQIQDSKNMDDYLCDHQLTAIYQAQKKLDETSERMDSDMNILSEKVDEKADNLLYNDETRELQLKSGEELVGDKVIVPADRYAKDIADAIEDEWSGMDEPDGTTDGENWESM